MTFADSTAVSDIDVTALVKGRERYVVLYRARYRDKVLRQFGRWASDPTISFSWYDAAVLSRKVREA